MKAEKEQEAQTIRNIAMGLRSGIDNFKEEYGDDMTDEIIEYLEETK